MVERDAAPRVAQALACVGFSPQMSELHKVKPELLEREELRCGGGTGFSLCGFGLVKPEEHRLKPVLPKPSG